jgi:hypothetical protein
VCWPCTFSAFSSNGVTLTWSTHCDHLAFCMRLAHARRGATACCPLASLPLHGCGGPAMCCQSPSNAGRPAPPTTSIQYSLAIDDWGRSAQPHGQHRDPRLSASSCGRQGCGRSASADGRPSAPTTAACLQALRVLELLCIRDEVGSPCPSPPPCRHPPRAASRGALGGPLWALPGLSWGTGTGRPKHICTSSIQAAL